METNPHRNVFLYLTFTLLLLLLISTTTTSKPLSFSKPISPETLGLVPKQEKLTHLHFYFHDTVSGKHPTAIPIVQAKAINTTRSFFGLVMMIDDPLTLGPEPNSTLVGKAQGIYGSASLTEVSFLMVINFAFMEGKYNGSNLSVLGRNSVLSRVREMPIVGGSGLFRFARGYAQAKTYMSDFNTGDAVVEYNVYVFHY